MPITPFIVGRRYFTCKLGEPRAVGERHGIGQVQDAVRPVSAHRGEGGVELSRLADADELAAQPQPAMVAERPL